MESSTILLLLLLLIPIKRSSNLQTLHLYTLQTPHLPHHWSPMTNGNLVKKKQNCGSRSKAKRSCQDSSTFWKEAREKTPWQHRPVGLAASLIKNNLYRKSLITELFQLISILFSKYKFLCNCSGLAFYLEIHR